MAFLRQLLKSVVSAEAESPSLHELGPRRGAIFYAFVLSPCVPARSLPTPAK